MRSSLYAPIVLAVALFCSAQAVACDRSSGDGAASISPELRLEVAEKFQQAMLYELDAHEVGAASATLIADGEIIWDAHFGYVDVEKARPADGGTIYRIGSITKLFTKLAVMQMVAEGRFDLDAPVSRYLTDFEPKNPFGRPVTVRDLITHRSGLVREPPVGSYFDDKPASLTNAVRSLNDTTLVFEPSTAFKYSNADAAVLGALAVTSGEGSFEKIIENRLLEPLAMETSFFDVGGVFSEHTPSGILSPYDSERKTIASTFQTGTNPSGGLYSTVGDLAKFAIALLDGGNGLNGSIATPSLLNAMWAPQGAKDGRNPFSLGFVLREINGARIVGHGGAIHGFTADLQIAPDKGAGVVLAGNSSDFRMRLLSNYALELLLCAQAGAALPDYNITTPPGPELRAAVEGYYRGHGKLLIVKDHGAPGDEHGRLFVEGLQSIGELRRKNDRWMLERGNDVARVSFDKATGAMTLDGATFHRIEPDGAEQADLRFAGLIGHYGWRHDYIRMYEWDGRPHVRIEWGEYSEIEHLGGDLYALPDTGLYPYETLQFHRDENGAGLSVSLNGIVFERRNFGAEMLEEIRNLVRSDGALRDRALRAAPPDEIGEFRASELVDVGTLDSTILSGADYASSDNFLGFPLYEEGKAVMQRPAAEALARVAASLRDKGYGLWVHDAYRPWYVTKMMWDVMPEHGRSFVADPKQGSRHNRGSSVDLSLYDLATGEVVEMTSGYDEFSPRAHHSFIGGTDLQRWRRDLLLREMKNHGFSVYPLEWWHFDHEDWGKYRIQNAPLKNIE